MAPTPDLKLFTFDYTSSLTNSLPTQAETPAENNDTVPVGKTTEEIEAAAKKAGKKAAVENPILGGKGQTDAPDLNGLLTEIDIPTELQKDTGFMAGMRKAYADAKAKFSKPQSPQSPQAQTTELQVNSKEAGTPVQSSAQSVLKRYKVLHQKLDDHSITPEELDELEKINLGEFGDAIKADEKASLTALDKANEGAFGASLELMGVTKEQLKDVKPFTPEEYAAIEAKCKNGEQLTPEENLRFAATIQKLKTRNLPSNADIEEAKDFVASHPEGIDSEDFQDTNLSPEAQSYISSTAGKVKTNSSIILLR